MKIFSVLAFCLLVHSASGQEVLYPDWANEYTQSYQAAPLGYLPSEYTGPVPDVAPFYFSDHVNESTFGPVRVQWSPHAGVLALNDRSRSSAPKSFGWATGMQRVYSVVKSESVASPGALTFFVSGWRTVPSARAVVVRVDVALGGAVSQAEVFSSATRIVVAASCIHGKLYFVDTQTHTCERSSDSNSDGVFDLLDASFSLPIPAWTGGSPPQVAEDYLAVVRGFQAVNGGVVRIDQGVFATPTRRAWVDIVLNADGTFGFSLTSSPPPMRFEVPGDIVVGQKKVRVLGPPLVKYSIEQHASGSPAVILRSNVLMSSNGEMLVDLQLPVSAAGKLKVVVPAPNSNMSSYGRSLSPRVATIFDDDEFWHQGKDQVIYHWNVKKTDKLWYSPASGSAPTFIPFNTFDATKFSITLPHLGTPGPGPYPKLSFVDFWITDTLGSTIKADALMHELWHL